MNWDGTFSPLVYWPWPIICCGSIPRLYQHWFLMPGAKMSLDKFSSEQQWETCKGLIQHLHIHMAPPWMRWKLPCWVLFNQVHSWSVRFTASMTTLSPVTVPIAAHRQAIENWVDHDPVDTQAFENFVAIQTILFRTMEACSRSDWWRGPLQRTPFSARRATCFHWWHSRMYWNSVWLGSLGLRQCHVWCSGGHGTIARSYPKQWQGWAVCHSSGFAMAI